MPDQPFMDNLDTAHFTSAVLQAVEPVLVVFGALWSRPCQVILPELEALVAECGEQVRVYLVNVDDNPDLGAVYDILSIPTLIWFLDGQERSRVVGTVSKKALLSKLEALTGGASPPISQSP